MRKPFIHRKLWGGFCLILAALAFCLALCTKSAQAQQQPTRMVYVLAAPFKTLTDEVQFAELTAFINGADLTDNPITAPEITILSEQEAFFYTLFGQIAADRVQIISDRQTALTACFERGDWLILPFDQLDPRLKVIAIDGQNPLHKDFDLNPWRLTVNLGGDAATDWENVPASNRDPEKLTTLLLTGVTALVRGTASYMFARGPEYPASNIYETLQDADILHVNNEVSFAPVCQQTQDEWDRLVFCSPKSALDLLTFIGTDVVELDGDHFQDYGDEAVTYTLDLYKEAGIPYYGGGVDLAEAQQPLLTENHGNKLAFIGCNGKEIGYAAASATRPGAAHCDIPLIVQQVKKLKAQGYLPVVTFQHVEVYRITPVEEMRADFKAVAGAGAVIVSGSQSHIPMAFEINADSFIHYGLGNLFFDQAFFLPETSEATLDRHVIYDGKHLSTEILTIKFTNLALNRFMTPEERIPVLERIYNESIVQPD